MIIFALRDIIVNPDTGTFSTKQKHMRDTQLDAYRSLSMIYIVCIIHLVYWLGLGNEPLKSLILIEMPVIFFISGASLSLKTSNKTFVETLKNRTKRVLLPYYIYAAVMVLFVAVMTLLTKKQDYDITSYTLKDISDILLAVEIPQTPYSWHLWFVMPYMTLSCLFVLHQKVLAKVKHTPYIIANIIAFVLIQHFFKSELLRHIFCYNIFMLAGYCYYKKLSRKQIFVILLAATAGTLALHYLADIRFTPMQDHKFPADISFLCYTTAALCFLSLIFSYIKVPYKGVLATWNSRGYTIYLWQNIVFFAAGGISYGLSPHIGNGALLACILIPFIFAASTLMSYATYPLEKFVVSKVKFLD